jgi:thioredoxin-dependent peroxiredoxin
MEELQKGDKAPAFTATDQNGNKVSLKDFKGKKVVLFTYPEDDTPTCTIEACNIRDNYSELTTRGIVVLGVSPDDEVKHKQFENKFSLPYTMLADPKMKILNAYGVYGEKQMYGKRYMGIFRRTFLIDEQGNITHIIKAVRSKEHVAQILKSWGV